MVASEGRSLPRSHDLTTFAQFSNIDEAVHEFVTALRPLAGKYAAGDPVSSFSYPDIQRVYDGASHIIIGQLAARPHPILSRILPAKISDKIQHSVSTTELLYTLPVANPHGGTNQSMSEKETVEWFHSRRYGIHFWLEGDYLNTPEGQFKLTQQMGRQVAYLNERGITEGYKALLIKPPHQVQEESGNQINELGTKNVRATNRDDFFTELERRNQQTAMFHKDPIGIHKAFDHVREKIQGYTYSEISPDCCIMPTLHAQILKNSSEYRINYSKGGQEAVDRLNSTALIPNFMGMDIYYAPQLMIDNRKMKHPARREKVHAEYAFIDTLLYKQIDMYDVSIDKDKKYTIRDLVGICNQTWCDATKPITEPRIGNGGVAGDDDDDDGRPRRRMVGGRIVQRGGEEDDPRAAADAARITAQEEYNEARRIEAERRAEYDEARRIAVEGGNIPAAINEAERLALLLRAAEEATREAADRSQAARAAAGRAAGDAAPVRGGGRPVAPRARARTDSSNDGVRRGMPARAAGPDSNVTYTVVDAEGNPINENSPLSALGHLKKAYLKSFEKQIFGDKVSPPPGSEVILQLHGMLFIQAMYSQFYMAIPFQKAGCGSVYFTRIHRTAAEDAVHQTDVYNATQYIGVAMTRQKHRWVLDDLVYAGIGPGANKKAILDLTKYKNGPPTQARDDPGMYVLPVFHVQKATMPGAQAVNMEHMIDNPRQYFTDESYFDIRGRFDCDDPKKPADYLLADAFLNTTGVGQHIKSNKAAHVAFRCTQKLYGLPAGNATYAVPDTFVPSAGPHGTHEMHGDKLVRSEGKSLYREAAAQLVKEV